MDKYLIKFYKDSKLFYSYKKNIFNSILTINDQFIEKAFQELNNTHPDVKFEDIHYDIFVGCSELNMVIEGYTLSDKICIFGFSNHRANLSLLKSRDINLHIVDADIQLAQVECKSIFLSGCSIKKLDINIENAFNNNKKIISNKIEIRNCSIGYCSVFSGSEYLIIQESVIDNMEVIEGVDNITIKTLMISLGTQLRRLRIQGHLLHFSIEDSEIVRVYLNNKVRIDKISNKNSYIENTFFCTKENFVESSIESWRWIKNSAKNNDDDKLYIDAAYEIKEIEGRKKFSIFNYILKWVIGYGYKPYRALIAIPLIIIIFAIAYFAIDSYHYVKNGYQLLFTYDGVNQAIDNFLNCVYFSGITFTTTGYGEVLQMFRSTKILSFFEASMGVSFLSLFIYSLTKRYIDK